VSRAPTASLSPPSSVARCVFSRTLVTFLLDRFFPPWGAQARRRFGFDRSRIRLSPFAPNWRVLPHYDKIEFSSHSPTIPQDHLIYRRASCILFFLVTPHPPRRPCFEFFFGDTLFPLFRPPPAKGSKFPLVSSFPSLPSPLLVFLFISPPLFFLSLSPIKARDPGCGPAVFLSRGTLLPRTVQPYLCFLRCLVFCFAFPSLSPATALPLVSFVSTSCLLRARRLRPFSSAYFPLLLLRAFPFVPSEGPPLGRKLCFVPSPRPFPPRDAVHPTFFFFLSVES